MADKKIYERFYEIIQKIPEGKVATYGQIAALAGYPGYARQVGYALNGCPQEWDLPWHRVVNAKGMVSIPSSSPYENIQRVLLEAEGIAFTSKGRIPLSTYQWNLSVSETNE